MCVCVCVSERERSKEQRNRKEGRKEKKMKQSVLPTHPGKRLEKMRGRKPAMKSCKQKTYNSFLNDTK